MATTTSGTVFTITLRTLPNGDRIQYGVADTARGATGIPLVLYTHGNNGNVNQFSYGTTWQGLRDWVIDNGWAYVESDGGGASSWGNAAARQSYEDAYITVSSELSIGPVVVLGRSMLGLVAYWLARKSPVVSPHVVGLMVNSGTTDLAAKFAGASSTDRGTMLAAFGATDDATFAANTVGYDPMKYELSDWVGAKVLQLYGTADTTVPAELHAIPWLNKYGPSCAVALSDVRQGGDHSAANGSYLQVEAMTSFMMDVYEPAPPPEPMVLWRQRAAYYVGADRKRYPITWRG